MSADIATNRKAGRDFHILEKYEAGLELKGTEVKSIRAGKVNVSDAFARVENQQVFLYGCDIQPWETAGAWFNHPAKRPRRLLLNKREILKLAKAQSEEIRNAADRDALDMKRGADSYAYEVLTKLEGVVAKTMSTIERGKAEIDTVASDKREKARL